MALGLTNNKAWFDKAFVSVAQYGVGTDVELRTVANSLSVSGGGTDIDSLEVFGGKIAKPSTREDLEISFDAIVASTRDLDWILHGASQTATTITSSSTLKNRVTMLWTDATGITSAAMTVGTAGEAYRKSYVEQYVTSLEYNMDAGEQLTATINFKGAFEDETGGQNYRKDTKIVTGTLSALSVYTGSNKF